MNSSYLNMAAGAFLGTVFVVMSVSLVSEALFHSAAPEQEGFAIEVAEDEGAGAGGAVERTPIAVLLASADASAGESVFRRCASCHTVEEGGANRTGPNLWDVVGSPIAHHEGYNYSGAMEAYSEGGAEVWDYEHLDGFLHAPRSYISGTSMSFAGLSNDQDRANVIAYLRELSNDPEPLPDPEEAAPADDAEGAAEGEAVEDGVAEEEVTPEEGTEPAADEPATEDGAAPAETDAAPADDDAAAPADDGAAAPATEDAAPAQDDAAPTQNEAAPADEDAAAPAEDGDAATEDDDATPAADDPVVIEDDEEAAAPAGEDATQIAAASGGPAVALLSQADAANGESLFRRCTPCHTAEEGGQNRVGPGLWDVVDRPVASVEGFNYSSALVEYAGDGQSIWDFARLDAYLLAPRDEVPGTSMVFAGIADNGDRADLLLFLRDQASDPAPLP